MDEILIEEKKYVSSKRAAKVTGYAKDYIGQLCREGRVPARLVGRSWYVLESAIHDHRFGDTAPGSPAAGLPKENGLSTSTWESPRYEASSAEILPSVNRLRDADAHPTDQDDVAQHLQDSWRAWFDRVADTEPVSLATLVVPEEQEKDPPIPLGAGEEEVPIPIHTVYELPPEDLLPRHQTRHLEAGPPSDEEEPVQKEGRSRRGLNVGIQVAGAVLAVLVAMVAVIGTGYFDEYIISNSQVGMIAGVGLYNR